MTLIEFMYKGRPKLDFDISLTSEKMSTHTRTLECRSRLQGEWGKAENYFDDKF